MRTIRQLALVVLALAVFASACTSTDAQRSAGDETNAAASSVSNSTSGEPSGSEGEESASSVSARRAEILSLVPESAESAVVLDLTAAKTRWGLTGVTSETDPESPEAQQLYSQLDALGLLPELSQSRSRYEQGGLSDLDVDVEISFQVDELPVRIDRMRSTLDLRKASALLEADGMVRSGTDEAQHYAYPETRTGEFYGAFHSGVTVYPDSHLLVAGRAGLWSPTADGSSLADAGTVADLIEDLGPADWFSVTTGADACVPPDVGAAMLESKEAARKYAAALEAAGERHPVTGTVVAVTADDAGSIRSTYADAATAAADQPVRTKILQTVDSRLAGQRYTQLLTATVTANASTLDYKVSSRPSTLIRMVDTFDVPWAFC